MPERTIYNEPRRTIDLRKPGVYESTPTKKLQSKQEIIEWSTYEYTARERGPYWFLFPGGVALALIVFSILTKNYFFVVFVTLAFLVLAVYMRRTPRIISFIINAEGVHAGQTVYPFSNIKTFWIFENDGTRELSLEIKSILSPFVQLPLGDSNAEKIRAYLLQFIPEEEHKEFALDKINRSLGL